MRTKDVSRVLDGFGEADAEIATRISPCGESFLRDPQPVDGTGNEVEGGDCVVGSAVEGAGIDAANAVVGLFTGKVGMTPEEIVGIFV